MPVVCHALCWRAEEGGAGFCPLGISQSDGGSQHIPQQLYLREVAALMGARVTEDFPEEVSEG